MNMAFIAPFASVPAVVEATVPAPAFAPSATAGKAVVAAVPCTIAIDGCYWHEYKPGPEGPKSATRSIANPRFTLLPGLTLRLHPGLGGFDNDLDRVGYEPARDRAHGVGAGWGEQLAGHKVDLPGG